MVSHIAEFEYINCATEVEALILENNLIKKFSPKYNILLRDDKTYPYIKVTLKEKYPRIIKTRQLKEDGNKYFGPYSDVKAVDYTVELLSDMFSLKRCSAQNFPKGVRPCLNYHIAKCQGICQGNISEAEYRKNIELAMSIISGKQGAVIKELERKMSRASEAMDFEEAAGFRDQINALKALKETQRAAIPGMKDMDIVLSVKGTREVHALVFFYRNGRLSGRESFPMQANLGEDSADIVSAFIKQYYGEMPSLPYEIITDRSFSDKQAVEEYLEALAGRKVAITVPKRAEKKALLELAIRDCLEICKNIDERAAAAEERIAGLSDEIYKLVSRYYPDFPKKQKYRVESYDISNTNGVDTVGGMVVFDGLRPARKDYRRFKIKTVQGPDDYASLRELVCRRFRRSLKGDVAFYTKPDLLLIDGGKGQVGVVLEALDILRREVMSERMENGEADNEEIARKLELLNMAVMGMAKDDHHRTSSVVACVNDEFFETSLSGKQLLFSYMGTVQEEVHRFAIEYHRKLRGKQMITSVLDDISGIGPKKRNALLAYFKSVEAIREAEEEQLLKVDGINRKNAEEIRKFFKAYK